MKITKETVFENGSIPKSAIDPKILDEIAWLKSEITNLTEELKEKK